MRWSWAYAGSLSGQPARIWPHYKRLTKVKDESISKVLEEWSATQRRLSNATASFLNESTDDLNVSSKNNTTITESRLETPKRKRRFSSETANDLLFWGCHLAIVAISLGIMWVKFEANGKALEKLLKAQSHEIDLVRGQALKADEMAQTAQNAERQRSLAFTAAQRQIEALVAQTQGIEADVKSALATANQTNQLVLDAISVAKAAALKSEQTAQSAAGNAGVAAARAGAAAASSGRMASVV